MQQWKQRVAGLAILAGLLTGSILQAAIPTTNTKPMPKRLWQAFSEARHQIEAVKESQQEGYTYKAYNPRMHYSIHFGDKGIVLKTKAGKVSMELFAYGQQKQLKPVSKAVLKSEGNKVIFQHARLSEWYINDPEKGLEQGFTLQKPKGYDNKKTVVLSMKLKGRLQAKQQSSTGVAFYDGKHKVFDYKGLKAFDAKGRSLPAHLALQGKMLNILVEATGAQWPVIVDPTFVTEQKVVASDATANLFGWAVSLDGNTALIGAPGDDDNGNNSGVAYIFTFSGIDWSEQSRLTGSDVAEYDRFGYAVSLDGDTALIGAPGDDDFNGSAYIFTRSGEAWSQQAKLTALNGLRGGNFGSSVSLDGDTALIGAYDDGYGDSGKSFVFIRSEGAWSQQAKLTALDAVQNNWFGSSVSLDGNTALIGAPHDDNNGTNSGSAYIFTRSGTDWSEQQKLSASDGTPYDYFGQAVSLDGDTALIGAPNDDDYGRDSGSVYVFIRSERAWNQQQKLIASDGEKYNYFGYTVSLDDDTALIGAYGDKDHGAYAGAAYIFTRSGTIWNQQQKLSASDGAQYSYFGLAVSLDGNTALIGAYNDMDYGRGSGAAYFINFPMHSQNMPITPIIMYLMD